MPLCHLYTSLKSTDVKDGVETRMAGVISKTLEKPMERITMVVSPGTRMMRLGTLAPACLLVIHSIGVFDACRNPKYTPALKQALQNEFNLPADRCILQYVDLDANFIG